LEFESQGGFVAKPFDAALKHLLEKYPADWLPLIGKKSAGPVEVIDADLSTVTAGADKVFRIGRREPWLLHLEMQAGRDRDLVFRLLRYNVLLDYRHRLPVLSVLVLLRPEADGVELQGYYRRQLPQGAQYLEFRYQVVRVWEQPVEEILRGGLGTLPLAPLSKVRTNDLPGIFERLAKRLEGETPPSERDTLWVATYVLMGLRYPLDFTKELFRGVQAMKESVTYQAIVAEGLAEGRAKGRAEGRAEGRVEGLAKGKIEGMKQALFLQGRKRLGRIDAESKAAIDAIGDLHQLEKLTERLLQVPSWKELLQSASSRRGNGRRSNKA
jgi:predicted transposase YdaD